MKHFLHPKNVGKIKNANGIAKVGNITCGDVLWLYIKVEHKKGKEIIKDIKFQTLGCPAAIASGSVMTELVKGQSLEKAMTIKNEDIAKVLGSLPSQKYHCSLLAEQALNEAIYDYFKKSERKIPKALETKHEQALKLEREFKKKFQAK